MLKVCKLDINWAAEGWGAAGVGGFSLPGDVRRLRPQIRALWPWEHQKHQKLSPLCSEQPRTELDSQGELPKPQSWDLGLYWMRMGRSLHLQSLSLWTLGVPTLIFSASLGFVFIGV